MTRSVTRILVLISIPIATTNGFTPVSRHAAFHRTRQSNVALQDSRTSLLHDGRHGSSRRESEQQRSSSSKWPRIFSRIIGRRSREQQVVTHHDSAQPLHMTPDDDSVMDQETTALLEGLSLHYAAPGGDKQDFILRNFQELSPNMVFPEVVQQGRVVNIEEEFFDVAITTTRPTETAVATVVAPVKEKQKHIQPAAKPSSTSSGRNLSVSRVMGGILENALMGIITRRSIEPPTDVSVQAQPREGGWNSLIRGKFKTDARIEAGKLVFECIRMSSGSLDVKRLSLNLLGFCSTPSILGLSSSPRFLKQFDLHFHKLTFSQEDILGSSCIHNGLRMLLVRILRDRGVQASSVQVTSVDILVRSQKKKH
jgi:hypothetical protein